MVELKWHTIVSPVFGENAFVVWRDGHQSCVIVDPGLDMESLFEFVDRENLRPTAILNTHGHADHIAGNGPAKDKWPEVPLLIGHGDEVMLSDPNANLSAMFGIGLTSPPADRLVNEGDTITFGEVDWEIFETPGHSPGHVVFVCKQCSPWIVLGGDMLFREGIGRTDFPGGDPQAMLRSIRDKLYCLPDDTVILPGHGEPTTIGYEKANNPFVSADG